MGNQQSAASDSCLLSKQEFNGLKSGHKFDHRDYEGRYLPVQIIWKSGNKAKIHYINFGHQYDIVVNYKQTPLDFANYGSVSSKAAVGALKNYKMGNWVAFKPQPQDPNCKWIKGKIVDFDADEFGRTSGQVKVMYSAGNQSKEYRWTHLDNSMEIRSVPQMVSQQQSSHNKAVNQRGANMVNCDHRRNGNSRHNSNHHHHHHHNHYNQRQMQQQVQMQRQDELTVQTQLLLDDTRDQIELTKNYLKAANDKNCDKKKLSEYNQKVVVGLTCFNMKVSGMREEGPSEGLDFCDAFKSSKMIVKQFEKECKQKFGDDEHLMKRLNPCLNYMRAVLNGKEDVPSLPYINEYKFNKKVVSSVISGVSHAQNHVLPDRINDINRNNQSYKKQQAQLKQQYENEKYTEDVKDIDHKHLIQDYHSKNIEFAKSKKEQDAIIAAQQHSYKYGAPDLMDTDGADDGF